MEGLIRCMIRSWPYVDVGKKKTAKDTKMAGWDQAYEGDFRVFDWGPLKNYVRC